MCNVLSGLALYGYGEFGVFSFFFFKQKTAYEMRISDWSSDVCSSDLSTPRALIWKTTAYWRVVLPECLKPRPNLIPAYVPCIQPRRHGSMRLARSWAWLVSAPT